MTYQICITQECNLDCCYCFEKKKNRKDFMDNDAAIQCCDFILSKHIKDTKGALHINISGGEPLVRFDTVKLIIDYITGKAQKLDIPEVHFEISSNATLLTQERIDFLNKGTISLFIGTDGLRESQDKNRKFVNGADSYPVVTKNLSNLFGQNKLDFKKVILNMVVTPNNVKNMYDNCLYLYNISHGGTVSINIANEQDWDSHGCECLRGELRKLGGFYLNVLTKINNAYDLSIFDRQAHVTIGNNSDINPECNCGTGVGALAILTNGDFYPCTSFSYAENSGDDLVIGNVSSGIDETALLNFRNKIAIDLNDCSGCDFLKKCFYYCPADNFRITGSMAEIPRSICELNKVVIAETDLFLASLYQTDSSLFWKKYGRES
jgi:uncharacterized protein